MDKPILDHHCECLLNEVQQCFPVHFTAWERDYCAFQVTQRDKEGKPLSGVVYSYIPFRCEKIAHELLHAKCEALLGSDMFLVLQPGESSSIAQIILDYNYWQEFSNQIQHKIMYADYVAMGYSPENFFESIDVPQAKINQFIQGGIKTGNTYNPLRLRKYLDILQHIMFFPIDNRTVLFLPLLKKLDRSLYGIHQCLFDVVAKSKIDIRYSEKLKEAEWNYRNEMCQWIENHNFSFPTMEEMMSIKRLRQV